jgi:hypothetical protein
VELVAVSGLAGLLREAARAGACVRRLEVAVERVRAVASEHGEWELLRAETRVAALLGQRDTFAPLASVLERVGSSGGREEQDAPAIRRLGGDAATRDARRGMRETMGTSGSVIDPGSASGTSEAMLGASARHRRTTLAHSRSETARGDSAPRSSLAAADANVRLEARESVDMPPRPSVGPRSPAGSRHEAIDATQSDSTYATATSQTGGARDGRAADAASSPAEIGPAERERYADPAQAAAILASRMRTAALLDAFRAVVLIHDTPEPRTHAPLLQAAVDSNRSLNRDAAPPDSPWDRPHQQSLELDPAAASEPQARIRSRQLDARIEPRPTGLRRLAALATESLDDIGQPVPPVQPTLPSVNLEDQLDRLLRAEAIAHGIDPEGLVR